jgi:threonine dehydrogenase-like Zn-dependent dehydrogenase
MNEIAAAVVTGFNQPLEVRQVPAPELEPSGLLIRVDAATLCGTDVHFWQGQLSNEQLPYIPGHEIAGTVVEVRGERHDVLNTPLRAGDRVISAYPFCGHCYHCTIANQPTFCPHGARYGRMRCDRPPYLLGGCAEYQYVPPGSDVIRIPDEVTSPLAASASCALRTVMHAFELLGSVASHETVLVQGCGPVGLYAAAVARDHGARRVLTIGAPANRLEIAEAWGADATFDLERHTEAERREWALEQTGGRGADIVIQAATVAAIPEGLQLLRPGGRYVSIGGGGGTLPIPASAFTNPQRIMLVRAAEGRHFYQALSFLATRRSVPFERLITGVYSLETTSEAMQAMADYREVKAVILPHGP